MKKLFIIIAVAAMLVTFAQMTFALDVKFYVDSAPNVYGAPSYADWWNQAKQDVSNNSFTNLRNGAYPGTLRIDPLDEIVNSTGDLGKRLHWIYWIPNTDIATLTSYGFQVKQVMDWDGVAYEWGASVDAPDKGWYTPGSWVQYGTGVIGTFGNAWWAGDNDALPYDNNGNLWDETDQADINAVRSAAFNYQTYSLGMYRYNEGAGMVTGELKVTVPEPATLMLLGFGLIGLAVVRRKA